MVINENNTIVIWFNFKLLYIIPAKIAINKAMVSVESIKPYILPCSWGSRSLDKIEKRLGTINAIPMLYRK